MSWLASIRNSVKRVKKLRKSIKALRPITERECPLCGYKGWFGAYGRPPLLDVLCLECGSLPRHRLLYLAIERGQLDLDIDAETDGILHFAAERQLKKIFRERFKHYKTAELYGHADLTLDLENIDLPDKSYKLVIANHVLEHVNDSKAASEVSRILTDDGTFLAMVPIVEGWETTYENETITDERDRLIHFGQEDHLRIYGRDFRQRIERGGLTLKREITAEGTDVINYGLTRGEKVFQFVKN